MATQTLTRPALRSTSAPKLRQPRKKMTAGRAAVLAVAALLAVLWLVPFAWATATAFKSETDAAAPTISWIPPSGFTADAFVKVFQDGNIPLWTWNSLYTSAAITVITLAISALVAYALSRIDFRGKKVLMTVIIASIIIPPPVLIIPLFYQMVALHMIDTSWAIILPQVIHPAMVFVLKKFFDQIPRELEEAAVMDGASRMRIFTQIILPLSRPYPGRRRDLRVHQRLEQLPLALHLHQRRLHPDPAGRPADHQERLRHPVRPEHGVRAARGAAAHPRFPVLPAPDHQGRCDDGTRRNLT